MVKVRMREQNSCIYILFYRVCYVISDQFLAQSDYSRSGIKNNEVIVDIYLDACSISPVIKKIMIRRRITASYPAKFYSETVLRII